MHRELQQDEQLICDKCGRFGAFDFGEKIFAWIVTGLPARAVRNLVALMKAQRRTNEA
jgi:hypothetical protein